MLHRQILRASRSLTAQAVESRVPQTFRPSVNASRTAQRSAVPASRWYSESAEAKKEENGDKAAEAEDPAKKELEEAKKQVTDLTVSPRSPRSSPPPHTSRC